MIRLFAIIVLMSQAVMVQAQIESSSFSPAKVLGVYQDSNSPTKKSWIIDTGTGISAVRIPVKKSDDLLTSLWGDCRGVLKSNDASKLAESDFCRAVRNPEFDQPERRLEAYTFGDPETAAKNYRKNIIFTALTLLPGLFSSSIATTTYLIPTDARQLETKPLEIEIRIYRGTIRSPELKIHKVMPITESKR